VVPLVHLQSNEAIFRLVVTKSVLAHEGDQDLVYLQVSFTDTPDRGSLSTYSHIDGVVLDNEKCVTVAI
jgi:hypothetical protein